MSVQAETQPSTIPNRAELSVSEEWTLIIRPQRHLLDLRLGELWQARDLVQLFVWRDFVAGYKQTILGPLWYLIQPLLTTITSIMGFENSHLWSPNAGQTNV